jgi:hypothetical protein
MVQNGFNNSQINIKKAYLDLLPLYEIIICVLLVSEHFCAWPSLIINLFIQENKLEPRDIFINALSDFFNLVIPLVLVILSLLLINNNEVTDK